MTRPHPLRTLLFVLAGAAALYVALAMLGHILVGTANADPAAGLVSGGDVYALAPTMSAAPPPAVEQPGLDWRGILAIIAAALASMSALLHVVAPRTKRRGGGPARG